MKRLDLIGHKYHRLTVTEFAGMDKDHQSLWKTKCDCGTEKDVRGYALRNGNCKSCGCLLVEQGRKAGLSHRTHRMTRTPVHNSWTAMINRCLNPNNGNYIFYGSIGVKVCDKWLKFEGFYEDMGDRPEGTTLDRINPFGDYTKENCRWADKKTQSHNSRKNYIKEVICRP